MKISKMAKLILLISLCKLGTGFITSPRSLTPNGLWATVPEYTGVDDAELDVDILQEATSSGDEKGSSTREEMDTQLIPRLQLAALEPGTVARVEVGDTSLARKAWKKRRRSGSPLLVPCSIIDIDRAASVRWNILYLLEKFGASHSRGIRISLADLCSRHRKHLQSSLTRHATLLGYESAKDLIVSLFPATTQETFGVQLVEAEGKHGPTLWIEGQISRSKGHKLAEKAAILQFTDDEDAVDTMPHTGALRVRNEAGSESMYSLGPLSAALRISQQEFDSGSFEDGSFHAATVFDFDLAGDGGSPLLVFSLNPKRNQFHDRFKSSTPLPTILDPKHFLHDLAVGQGPIEGKIVKLVKGGALVDCSIGRKKAGTDEAIKVLGRLSFKDAVLVTETGSTNAQGTLGGNENPDGDMNDIFQAVNDEVDHTDASNHFAAVLDQLENDEEFADSEDITHLFEMGEDGTLVYSDPDSGEVTTIFHGEEEGEEEIDDDDDDEEEEEDDDINDVSMDTAVENPSHSEATRLESHPQWLQVSDSVNVYIKSVSKQNGQIQFSLDSTTQGRKAKDIKKEDTVQKRLKKLAAQFNGIGNIAKLHGRESDGVVKALSNTGSWCYVKPSGELPVGVATALTPDESFDAGTRVRIRIEGIDEDRGQLAMTILHKL